MAQTETRKMTRLDAMIPQWLRDEIEADVHAVGYGPRTKGGLQGVTMAALLLYLAIDPEVRMKLAKRTIVKDRDIVIEDTAREWPVRLLRAVGTMDSAAIEALIASIESGTA